LAGAVAQPPDQGRLDRSESVDRRQHVGDEDAGLGRLVLTVLIRELCVIEAAGGMHDGGIGRLVGTRPRLPEAGDRAVDELGASLRQVGVIETEPLHHAGPKVLQYDIARSHKIGGDRTTLGRLEINSETSLAAIEMTEVGAVAVAKRTTITHVVTRPFLDL